MDLEGRRWDGGVEWEWVVGRRGRPEGALADGWLLLVEPGGGGIVMIGRCRERIGASVGRRKKVQVRVGNYW